MVVTGASLRCPSSPACSRGETVDHGRGLVSGNLDPKPALVGPEVQVTLGNTPESLRSSL